jgi:hypothetical protein
MLMRMWTKGTLAHCWKIGLTTMENTIIIPLKLKIKLPFDKEFHFWVHILRN